MKVKLGEAFLLKAGRSIKAKDISEDATLFPCFGGNGLRGYTDTYTHDGEYNLIGRQGALCGNVQIASGKFYATEHAVVVKPLIDCCDNKWLFYALTGMKLNQYSTGAAQPGLSVENLNKLELDIPDYPMQKRRAESLDSLSRLITARKHEIQKLEELIKARFVELFGNPVLNDKGWEQQSLGDITTKIGSGATPKGGKGAYQEEGITLIRSMNVHNGQFEYKELAHISDEQAAKLDNVTIEENDVLLNITGASVARSCVVPSKVLPARVNQHVCIIRCKECIIPDFLNKLLIDDNYQDLLWSIAGSGATREAITKQQVESLQIIMPPIELQNEFVAFCKQVDKSKVAVQAALDKAQLLFDSLMQEYFG